MNIPHLDQWLGDWAMEPDRFQCAYQAMLGLDLHVHLQTGPAHAQEVARQQAQPFMVGNVEILFLTGTLMKSVPSAADGTSTVIARRRIRAAAENPKVSGILLHIDSPGGTVDGTELLAADVAAAAKRKPVYAYIDDLGASAAYWIASQATKVFANGTALVGSIGTYAVVHDLSAKAAMQGVKVHVVRAGAMKGAGAPGTEISAELLAMVQERITERNEFFLRGVATGRGLSIDRVRELADGRVHIASKAKELKLIDGVQSFEETHTQLVAAVFRSQSKMDATQMQAVAATAVALDATQASSPAAPALVAAPSPTSAPAAAAAPALVAAPSPTSAPAAAAAPAPVAAPAVPAVQSASLAQLKAACPGASNDFLVQQLEAGATMAAASTAWMVELTRQNTELKAKAAAPAPAPAARKPGASPVPAAAAGESASQAVSGDAIAQWDEQLQSLMTDRKLTKAKAARELAIKEPELHSAYIAAYTQLHGPKLAGRK